MPSAALRVLALEPYYGGSHRAFLDGWSRLSHHRFQVLGLPPHHWKWRMRHAAITFSETVRERLAAADGWDVVLTSSMLDLATFRGLAPAVATLPTVVYWHENQLTYPVRHAEVRDLHFAFTHLTTGLAADALWLASEFHRDAFFAAVDALVARLPETRLAAVSDTLRRKTAIEPQGVEPMPPRAAERSPGPLRVVWAARWEHDKAPGTFFAALDRLAARGVDFRVDVLGQSFRQVPEVFARAKARHASRIGRWGYVDERSDYRAALANADVFVSTARHEFFGVAAAEACAAGCFPLLPDRLAYPELLAKVAAERRSDFFYGGSSHGDLDGEAGDAASGQTGDGAAAEAEELAGRLEELAERLATGGRHGLWRGDPHRARRAVRAFLWPSLAPRLDDALSKVAG